MDVASVVIAARKFLAGVAGPGALMLAKKTPISSAIHHLPAALYGSVTGVSVHIAAFNTIRLMAITRLGMFTTYTLLKMAVLFRPLNS